LAFVFLMAALAIAPLGTPAQEPGAVRTMEAQGTPTEAPPAEAAPPEAAPPTAPPAPDPGTPTSAPNTPAPPIPPPEPEDIDGFGLGVRLGHSSFTLEGAGDISFGDNKISEVLDQANTAVDAYNNRPGATDQIPRYDVKDLDLEGSLFMVIPVIHFGGSGFFYKFEFPMGFSATLNTYGIGMYPLNYGYYFEEIDLFPYASIGAVLSYASSKKFEPNSGGSIDVNAHGALIQGGRIAIGAKYRPIPHLSLGIELGITPYALGGVVDSENLKRIEDLAGQTPNPNTPPPPNPGSAFRAGTGLVFDISGGAEWL
jgi:hypothetical protein